MDFILILLCSALAFICSAVLWICIRRSVPSRSAPLGSFPRSASHRAVLLCFCLLFLSIRAALFRVREIKCKYPISIIRQLRALLSNKEWKKRESERERKGKEDKEWADKCVCAEITMHHKPINPLRGRGRDGEPADGGESNKGTDMKGSRKKGCRLRAGKQRELRGKGNVRIRREQGECQKAENLKYRQIQREKKTNVSSRGLTLSFLYGEEREKKEDFHLLSSQPPLDISLSLSLSLSLSHILISLVCIHRVGTDSLSSQR